MEQKDTSATAHTILVAEDNEFDEELLRRAFDIAGISDKVQFVCDGQEVINYLHGKTPFNDRQKFPNADVLLLDLKLPRMNGFEVMKWIRSAGLTELPVLVLSGSDLPQDEMKAFALGAQEYHIKSPDLQRMAKLLKGISQRWLHR